MSLKVAKFNNKKDAEFIKVLKKRVNQHFKDKNITKYANFNMKFKTAFMVGLYFIPLIMLFSGYITTNWGVIGMWLIMGLGMAGIGLSIMHDANHGSYSKNKKINKRLGFLINFIGGYHITWIIQHNVLHHSFTNVEGLDDDINNKILRFSPSTKHESKFKYQAYWAPLVYLLMSIYWFTTKDFEQIKKYEERGLLAAQKLTYKQAFRELLFHKAWYLALFVAAPVFLLSTPWWVTVLGFFTMHFICGLSLALIFQPAHVTEDTDFYQPDNNQSIDNNWAIHQMKTTSNFANDNKFFSWFIGCLNFQIEHHLFPNVCHIHYRDISKIVRATAKEFNVPYLEHKTFFGAVKSHFTVLDQLGKNTYAPNPSKFA